VETLNSKPELRVDVWPQGQSPINPVYAGLSLRPISCTPALSVTQSAAVAALLQFAVYGATYGGLTFNNSMQ